VQPLLLLLRLEQLQIVPSSGHVGNLELLYIDSYSYTAPENIEGQVKQASVAQQLSS